MKRSYVGWFFAVATIAIFGLTAFLMHLPAAQAQQAARAAKWEYGFLALGIGDPVFTTGRQQLTARPPTGAPGGGVMNNGQLGDQVNIVSKDVWTADLLALNAFGAEGWEAVSMVTDGRKTTILMRRAF